MTQGSDLLTLPRRGLMQLLRDGHPVNPEALSDTQYRGISLGLPGWVESLTWKKFMKTFARRPRDGALVGWNVRIEQDGLDRPWTPMRTRDGERKTFGHFEVVEPEAGPVPEGLGSGLLIHYGLGGNRPLDPISRVRDPLVALRPGDPSLLLGWSYLDLGLGLRLGTPSFFSLELDGALSHVVTPPKPPSA